MDNDEPTLGILVSDVVQTSPEGKRWIGGDKFDILENDVLL